MGEETCPLCESNASIKQIGHLFQINCPGCGTYEATEGSYNDYLINKTQQENLKKESSKYNDLSNIKILIRYYLQKKEKKVIDSIWLEKILTQGNLPSIAEQADNLTLWLGENNEPEFHLGDKFQKLCQFSGSPNQQQYLAIINGLRDLNLIKSDSQGYPRNALTFHGWLKHEELTRKNPVGHNVFMAMKFGDIELDKVLNNYFRPAVEETGFRLLKINDEPKAGLIDNRMRYEIRTARFVIADLSHDNLGAYWEAGFAEGIGKSVIYTCEKTIFEQKGTHFDTSHHLTIIWDKDNLEKAKQDLIATIRYTIPEAK